MGPDVFNAGVADLLRDIGSVTVPWQQAVNTEFDLALTASLGGVHEIHAPLIVMPHGAGYNKLAARPMGRAVRGGSAYGLDAQRLLHDGALIPAALVLAHRAELARLGRSCPEALPAATVVGDPAVDRLLASRDHRAAYRRALGVADGQRLVVVTSTWGPRSLVGSRPELLPRLLADLPPDEYRVVTLLHPNVWFGHGAWQVKSWLAVCLRRGLSLVPPEADWRAVLAAADFVVGDHGSATLYGAVAGVPVLLACHPAADLDPDAAFTELAAIAPRVSRRGSLRTQLIDAEAGFSPAAARRVAGRITSEPGRFNRNMRRLMYRLMGLRQPTTVPITRPATPPFLAR